MIPRKLSDYVRSYPDVLPASQCSQMILEFEAKVGKLETRHVLIEGFRDFQDCPVNELPGDMTGVLVAHLRRFINRYQKEAGIHAGDWPVHTSFEKMRVKRYAQGVGQFARHVDVADHESARRFMVFMFYLNDVEEGGETVFYNAAGEVEMCIKPKRGTLLMFPPLWLFPHAGMMPKSGPKYTAGGYLHYVSQNAIRNAQAAAAEPEKKLVS